MCKQRCRQQACDDRSAQWLYRFPHDELALAECAEAVEAIFRKHRLRPAPKERSRVRLATCRNRVRVDYAAAGSRDHSDSTDQSVISDALASAIPVDKEARNPPVRKRRS